jgi:FtsH-binding integral membrane protein
MASTTAVLDNRELKLQRMEKTNGTELSRRAYNAVIGAVLAIGLIINAAMAQYLPASAFEIMVAYPWAVIIGFLVVAIGSVFVIYKSDNPVVSFIGFIVLSAAFGYLVASAVQSYTETTVTRAFMLTAAISLAMVVAATIAPGIFARMGSALFAALVITLIAEVATILITHTDPIAFDFIFVIIFSLYIGYDWQKAQSYPPTYDNAVDSAADIYVDIVNLFLRLLAIFGRDN